MKTEDFKFQIMIEAYTKIKYVKLVDIIKHLDMQIKEIKNNETRELLEFIRSQYIEKL